MRRLVARICFGLAMSFALPGRGAGVDFWVWHRNAPLTEAEREGLARLGTTVLYWHVGEMVQATGQWRWKSPPRMPDQPAAGLRVVPVVRLTNNGKQPFAAPALSRLREELVRVAGSGGTLQLDFDCPDRLLPEYAAALGEIRRGVPHLSITALTNWPRLAGFDALTRAVEEIAPMFYDMQADPTGVTADSPPPSILDPAQIETAVGWWKDCPIPWRAGLPTFARLTVFDRTGLSRGQILNWDWDDLCFQKWLGTATPTRLGNTLLRVEADTRVASTPVAKDEWVVSRFTDRPALARAMTAARAAGATGIVLFRLPDGRGPGGWSLSALSELGSDRQPRLTVRKGTGDQLELVNETGVDLGPRLSGEKGDRDRGYALEIDAPAPIFREALGGDFWRVTSHTQPDAKKPMAVVVPLATRLTFWFSHLPARGVLQTGLLQLAPEARFESLRYRILAGGEVGEWMPILPALPAAALNTP